MLKNYYKCEQQLFIRHKIKQTLIKTTDILKFIEGTLPEDQRYKVQLWIDSSESNRKEYVFYKSILEKSTDLDDIILLDENSAWEDFEKKTYDSDRTKIIRFRERLNRIISVAAAFLILYIAYVFIFNNEPLYKEVVSKSEKDTIYLADGSIVYLDTFAKLRYFTKLEKNAKVREVELSGKATFKISHNDKLPFVLKAGGAGIEVLGTIFKTELSEKGVGVENIEGLIKLFEWENPDNSATLKEGEKAFFSGGAIKKIEPPKEIIPKGRYYKVEDLIEYLFDRYEIQFNTAPYAEIQMNDSVFVYLNQPLDSIINQLELTSEIKYRKTCKNCYEIKVLKRKY